ncbi:MAG: hypothetical protein COB98_02155 [Flavobacteriaceae bacterium]|nr:MAG: hypothetical protein COB98_02155 [Flavobacteriaceae bacterium]
MNKTSLLFFLLICLSTKAQETSIQLLGTVLSNTKRLANIHIINLNTKSGTISNENGEFLIRAQLNDTLYISSIQYEKATIIVSEIMIRTKTMFIETVSKTYTLEEVIIKNHHLTESIYHDILNKPKDSIPAMNVSSETFKNLDFTGVDYKLDAMSLNRPPSVEHLVNPIMAGGGVGATLPNNQLIAEYKLRSLLKLKKEFPSKIIQELGEAYFTKKLQIPTDSIHHFLSYCAYKDIVHLYQQNNLLTVIEILQEEAISYKKLKKEGKSGEK